LDSVSEHGGQTGLGEFVMIERATKEEHDDGRTYTELEIIQTAQTMVRNLEHWIFFEGKPKVTKTPDGSMVEAWIFVPFNTDTPRET
jgi:hypothetical protein